jgi:hypothetical protein
VVPASGSIERATGLTARRPGGDVVGAFYLPNRENLWIIAADVATLKENASRYRRLGCDFAVCLVERTLARGASYLAIDRTALASSSISIQAKGPTRENRSRPATQLARVPSCPMQPGWEATIHPRCGA